MFRMRRPLLLCQMLLTTVGCQNVVDEVKITRSEETVDLDFSEVEGQAGISKQLAPQAKGINTAAPKLEKPDPSVGITTLKPATANLRGQAKLSYPIKLPPGVNNLTPELSINYTSGVSGGNCGVGWSIPFSSIEIDTHNNGVPKYDGSDPLLLDGRPLVNIGGNVYRFETEMAPSLFEEKRRSQLFGERSFWRIEKLAADGFVARLPNGSRIHYGTKRNLQDWDPEDSSRVFRWYITEFIDANGNVISFGRTHGAPGITTILYGGSRGSTLLVSIGWQDRQDARISLRSGFKIVQGGVVDKITVSTLPDDRMLKEYDLSYDTSAVGSTLLFAVTELDPAGRALNEHHFNYHEVAEDESGLPFFFGETETIPVSNFVDPVATEWTLFGLESPPLHFYGSVTMMDAIGPYQTRSHDLVRATDINGDGLTDIVARNLGYPLEVFANKQDSLGYADFRFGPLIAPHFTDGYGECLRDFAPPVHPFCDLLYVEGFYLSDTLLFHDHSEWFLQGFVDVNRDGLPDQYRGSGVQLNNGSGFETTIADYFPYVQKFNEAVDNCNDTWDRQDPTRTTAMTVDFNGDQYPDYLVKRACSPFELFLNDGSKIVDTVITLDVEHFSGPFANGGHPGPEDGHDLAYFARERSGDTTSYAHELLLLDINGDGLPDRVGKSRSGSRVYVQLGNGIGFVDHLWDTPHDSIFGPRPLVTSLSRSETGHGVVKEQTIKILDINGDGLVDRVAKFPDDPVWYVQFNTGSGFADTQGFLSRSADFETLTVAGNQNSLLDMDGDGCVDRVLKRANEEDLYVEYNQLTWVNQLRRVYNMENLNESLLDYEMVAIDPHRAVNGNYRQKRVLSTVSMGNAGLDYPFEKTYSYQYGRGIEDRLERTFRGFETVSMTEQSSSSGPLDVTLVRYDLNSAVGMGPYGLHPVYDHHINGLVLEVTRYIQKDSTYNERFISKREYSYSKVRAGEIDGAVRFVFPETIVDTYYDSEGREVQSSTQENDVEFVKLAGVPFVVNITRDGAVPHAVYEKTMFEADEVHWLWMPYHQEIKNGGHLQVTTEWEYDSNGRLLAETQTPRSGPAAVRNLTYDAMGHVESVTERELTRKFVSDYNDRDRDRFFESVSENADGMQEKVVRDVWGRVVEIVDRFGDSTEVEYDNYGRKLAQWRNIDGERKREVEYKYKDPTVGSQYYEVEATYENDTYITPSSRRVQNIRREYFYDLMGRWIQTKTLAEVDGAQRWVVSGKIIRDGNGRVIEQGTPVDVDTSERTLVDIPHENPTSYGYDELGRCGHSIDASGYQISRHFETMEDAGRVLLVVTSEDSSGKYSEHKKDLYDNTVSIVERNTDMSLAETRYKYETDGNVQIEDPVGLKGYIRRDGLGRFARVETPDFGSTVYKRNDLGLVAEITHFGRAVPGAVVIRKGQKMTYDSLNRIDTIEATAPAYLGDNNTDIKIAYYRKDDACVYCRSRIKSIHKGKLRADGSMQSTVYEVAYEYGPLWIEETKKLFGETKRTRYLYDRQGRISHLTYPDGEVVVYGYDSAGRLLSVIGEMKYLEEIQYNRFMQRSFVRYGNGNNIRYSYQGEKPLLDRMQSGVGDLLRRDDIYLDYDYDFQSDGLLASVNEELAGELVMLQQYKYDGRGRLFTAKGKSAIAEEFDEKYSFDDASRFETKQLVSSGAVYRYTYDRDSHALENIVNSLPRADGFISADFGYDSFGNMVKRKISRVGVDAEEMSLGYDADNRLSVAKKKGLEVKYSYDQTGTRIAKEVKEESGSGGLSLYLSAFYDIVDGEPNKHISDGQYVFASIPRSKLDDILFYTQNHVGSTVMLTDRSGDKVQKMAYRPFGNTWFEESSVSVDRLYTNQIYDRETGLYYYNARYFDPVAGSFISPDPAMEGTNHYAYVRGNPINFTDPSGMNSLEFVTEALTSMLEYALTDQASEFVQDYSQPEVCAPSRAASTDVEYDAPTGLTITTQNWQINIGATGLEDLGQRLWANMRDGSAIMQIPRSTGGDDSVQRAVDQLSTARETEQGRMESQVDSRFGPPTSANPTVRETIDNVVEVVTGIDPGLSGQPTDTMDGFDENIQQDMEQIIGSVRDQMAEPQVEIDRDQLQQEYLDRAMRESGYGL